MDTYLIPELKKADLDYRKNRRKARKAYEKLKKLKQKYYFIDRIVEPRKDDDTKKDDVDLEWAVYDLFQSIGFECKKPKKENDVDVIVCFKKQSFGIEVKNGNLVGENDLFQAHKYRGLHNESYHPLIIYNNAKYNDSFGENRVKIAKQNNFGVVLTSELRKGFLKLKKNKITFDQFIKQLKLSGEIKYSVKALEKSKNSDIS